MTKKPTTPKPSPVPTPVSAWPLVITASDGSTRIELNRDGSVSGAGVEDFLNMLSGASTGEAALGAVCAWLVKRVEDLTARVDTQAVYISQLEADRHS